MLDTQKLIHELILHAESEEPLEFRFIRTWSEYRTLRKSRKAMKALLKVLRQSTENLLETYCNEIEIGTAAVHKLLACRILVQTINYYERDYETLDTMLGEYELYLVSGNLFDFVWYGGRPEKKLWDYRGFFNGDIVD